MRVIPIGIFLLCSQKRSPSVGGFLVHLGYLLPQRVRGLLRVLAKSGNVFIKTADILFTGFEVLSL